MTFKIYDCDFGIKYKGVSYEFEHVAQLGIETTKRNRITRGANAEDSEGLVYVEGMRDPDTWTIPVLNMPVALKTVLDEIFKNRERCDVYCIDRKNGSSKMAKTAILCNLPMQLTIDDSAESMEVSLEFQTFDSSEVFKE